MRNVRAWRVQAAGDFVGSSSGRVSATCAQTQPIAVHANSHLRVCIVPRFEDRSFASTMPERRTASAWWSIAARLDHRCLAPCVGANRGLPPMCVAPACHQAPRALRCDVSPTRPPDELVGTCCPRWSADLGRRRQMPRSIVVRDDSCERAVPQSRATVVVPHLPIRGSVHPGVVPTMTSYPAVLRLSSSTQATATRSTAFPSARLCNDSMDCDKCASERI